MTDDATRHLPVEALDEWTAAACARLGLSRGEIDVAQVLDLARVVAHGVARPAAPLSAFLAGFAAGRAGGDPASEATAAIDAVAELAESWRGEHA